MNNVISDKFIPLAARMRPKNLDEFVGQEHLVGKGQPLRIAIEKKLLHSMILWGPPGSGKTTLANLIAKYTEAHFEKISAVLAGVKEIREIIKIAQQAKQLNQNTILFVDEVHRFNKSQQDAFLPHVENGTIILIGATTENPSFELNNALLSRSRVYLLKPISEADCFTILNRVISDKTNGYGNKLINFPENLQRQLVKAADGDARCLLNLLEVTLDSVSDDNGRLTITKNILKEVLQQNWRRFDKGGDIFYDQISALHKSVRGSNPDAALYWFARMLDGGCDPLYIARRVVRMASEDIGNADPRALTLALNAWDVQVRLGSPEGELAIAQAIIYLSCAAKSNAVYVAFKKAMQDAKNSGSLSVPAHLRNAPTKLMKEIGCAKNYRYPHDEDNGYVAGENYFPEAMQKKRYYQPVNRGLEIKIAEKLEQLRIWDSKCEGD